MDFPVSLPHETLALAESLRVHPDDITERFTRGSGPGGQKINKTNNCVELTYVPTGTVVRVQRHRERSANRLSAYKLLIRKIETLKKGKQSTEAKRRFKLRKQKQRRTRRAKEKMLADKKHRSGIKKLREMPEEF